MQTENQVIVEGKATNTPARWITELKTQINAMKPYCEKGKAVEKKYKGACDYGNDKNRDGTTAKNNSFNILYSNTELLLPAIFTRMAKPIVRPRFVSRSAIDNSIAKAASEVLQRALEQSCEQYDAGKTIEKTVKDGLLPSRGVARVKYEAYFIEQENEIEIELENEIEGQDQNGEVSIEIETTEVLDYESAMFEYVHWDDLVLGSGRCFDEIEWIAFKHLMTREQLEEKFGKEKSDKIKLDHQPITDEEQRKEGEEHLLDRATVYELWDKVNREVKFIHLNLKEFLLIQEDPLELKNFWPMPEPLQFITTNDSTLPVIEFSTYETLANDLELVTRRIINIVDVCRVRGCYDASLSELERLFSKGDNEMIAIADAARFAEEGGLDKLIWIMPIERIIVVLRELYQYRAALIQAIYEITGISDILRGSTSDIETARAQEIKSTFGTLRLQPRQKKVQNFVRDLIRIKAEIIAEKFEIESLQRMTGLDYPTQDEKTQAQMMMLQTQQMQAQGIQLPQSIIDGLQQTSQIINKPTWEEIKQVLSSDVLRNFAVEIETDSTIVNEAAEDKRDITDLLRAVIEYLNAAGGLVQSGVMPLKTAKALLMAAVRRYHLGTEVEDALNLIGENDQENQQSNASAQQQPSPEVQVEQLKGQQQQEKMQFEIQKLQLLIEQERKAHEYELQQIQARAQAQVVEQEAQLQDKLMSGMS